MYSEASQNKGQWLHGHGPSPIMYRQRGSIRVFTSQTLDRESSFSDLTFRPADRSAAVPDPASNTSTSQAHLSLYKMLTNPNPAYPIGWRTGQLAATPLFITLEVVPRRIILLGRLINRDSDILSRGIYCYNYCDRLPVLQTPGSNA